MCVSPVVVRQAPRRKGPDGKKQRLTIVSNKPKEAAAVAYLVYKFAIQHVAHENAKRLASDCCDAYAHGQSRFICVSSHMHSYPQVQVQGWSRTVRVSRGSSHPGRAQACILFWYIGLESLDTVQDNCPYLASQGTAVSEQSSRVGPSQLIDTSQASSRAGHSQLVISSQSSAHTQLSGAGEHACLPACLHACLPACLLACWLLPGGCFLRAACCVLRAACCLLRAACNLLACRLL